MKPFLACFVWQHPTGRRYSELENKIVNLNRCKAISKGAYAEYPDNNGIPTIKFHGCGVSWYFNDVEQRDAALIALVSRLPSLDNDQP